MTFKELNVIIRSHFGTTRRIVDLLAVNCCWNTQLFTNGVASSNSLRVSALLSAPRCDTTQLLFIPIRLAPIWVIHSGYADPRPRPKCTPQCLLGRRTRKNGVFRLLSCFPVSFSYSVYLIMEIVACFFWLVLLSIRLLLFHKRFQLRWDLPTAVHSLLATRYL